DIPVRDVGECEVNQFGKEHAMFVVLFPEIAPGQLMFPEFLEKFSLTIPLIVIRHIHAVMKNQSEDRDCWNRRENKRCKPEQVKSTRIRHVLRKDTIIAAPVVPPR